MKAVIALLVGFLVLGCNNRCEHLGCPGVVRTSFPDAGNGSGGGGSGGAGADSETAQGGAGGGAGGDVQHSGPVLCLLPNASQPVECLFMPGGASFDANAQACLDAGGDPSGNVCPLNLVGCCDLQEDTACYDSDRSVECYQEGGSWQVSQ